MPEDDDGDVDGAEDGELMGLLEQTAFALEEGDAAVAVVANCARGDISKGVGEVVGADRKRAWGGDDEGNDILGLISILRLPMVAVDWRDRRYQARTVQE